MRKDCVLSTLTGEQKADLFDWLATDTYDVVLKRIAKPPPTGFGIRTHRNTLHRFYQESQARARALDLADLSAKNQQSVPDAQPFYTASHFALAHSTYVLANSPLAPANYRAVSRVLSQREDASLKREYLDVARQYVAVARERLQFDRTQFEYNAARAALALLPELVAIDQMNGLDDEAKIWRVRDRLFGPSPAVPSQMQNDHCSMLSVQSSPTQSTPSPTQTDLK